MAQVQVPVQVQPAAATMEMMLKKPQPQASSCCSESDDMADLERALALEAAAPTTVPRGTFALYSLISRHAKVSLVPNHQAEDDINDEAVLAAKPSLRGSVRRRTVQLASLREQRAQWVKQLLETSKPVRISLFLLTVLATAMVISDACLTPAISVLSAVGGLKDKAPNLTTERRISEVDVIAPPTQSISGSRQTASTVV
ncbi:potassium transporter 22-like [Panicum miliaceum]|uniref:Potassium transporter 22-like n=1 Tax=Panicum miliaceum TaxID=4540 RepID=A0A3L6T9G3_PANMI|nr:potassium transporter 22-like [Panicum miliaceum]